MFNQLELSIVVDATGLLYKLLLLDGLVAYNKLIDKIKEIVNCLTMTLYQFNALDEAQQWQIVWDLEPVAFRMNEEIGYNLYAINDFYIEVKYVVEGEISTELRPFKTDTLLEPYLQQIDISNLIE